MKTIVLVGASSDVAAQFIEIYGIQYELITISRNGAKSHWKTIHHQVTDYNVLPDLSRTIHGLVYFPGSIVLKPFKLLKPDDFIQDIEINLVGAVKVLQKYLPYLTSENASVVMFSSLAATSGMPYHSSVAVAKAAVEGLTRSLAAEYAPHIRFNAIAPSLTATKLASRLINTPEKITTSAQRHPLKRIGTTNDLAHIIHFLLSDDSSWMTGQVLHIDGGMSTIKS